MLSTEVVGAKEDVQTTAKHPRFLQKVLPVSRIHLTTEQGRSSVRRAESTLAEESQKTGILFKELNGTTDKFVAYDVNSLFNYIAINTKFPIGKPQVGIHLMKQYTMFRLYLEDISPSDRD